MSGIAGIIHFDGAPVGPGLVETMTAAMAHRGPDGIRHWRSGPAALGQCMLRTTPESLEESQPLTNEDASLALVMDGRVDNWEELRRELLGRGTVLRDCSDAELVLRSYQAWGPECLSHIDGDFAFVVWDARRREAFCGRDRLGNKPFNYHWDGKTLSFASELRAILELPWVKQEPNEGMLAEWLAGEWHSRDETLWNGILRLEASHRMLATEGGLRIERYWEPDLWALPPYRKDEDYFEHYREILVDAVRRLSRSHRPVAVEVSGGLDSSAVFCLAEHLRRQGRLPAPAIEGYTLAFSGKDGAACELDYARAVGGFLGLGIHEIPPFKPPPAWFAERARADREHPGFPNGATFANLFQQAAAAGSRATLGGEVADFWLTGSRIYYAEELAQRHWRTALECFKSDAMASGTRQAAAGFVRQGLFPLLPPTLQENLRRLLRKTRGTGSGCPWLSPHMQKALDQRRNGPGPTPGRAVGRLGQRDLLAFLGNAFNAHIMELDERLSARFGVEPRRPFCDRRFIQHAFATPARLRLRGGRSKYIHVQALQDLMPQIILERRSKAEFSSVFRARLEPMRETLTETLPRKRAGWVSQEGMAQLFEAFRNNPQDGAAAWILWSIHGCDRTCP